MQLSVDDNITNLKRFTVSWNTCGIASYIIVLLFTVNRSKKTGIKAKQYFFFFSCIPTNNGQKLF